MTGVSLCELGGRKKDFGEASYRVKRAEDAKVGKLIREFVFVKIS
jgi:hypothetical protein